MIPSGCCPSRKRRLGHRHSQRDGHVRTREQTAICTPRRAQGEPALPTAGGWIPDVQARLPANKCLLSKLPGLWCLSSADTQIF